MDRGLPSGEQDTQAPAALPVTALSPATALLTLADNASRCLLRFDRPGTWRVGRAPDCDVILAEPTVSRHHCLLTLGDGQLRVADLGSVAGTLVGGRRIAGPVELRAGDTLTLGGTELSIRAGLPRVAPEAEAEGFDVPPPLSPAARQPATSMPAGGLVPAAQPGLAPGGRREERRSRARSDFPPAGERVTVRGIARSASVRSEPLSELGSGYPSQVLTCSVHTFDAHGDPGAVVAVEMTGLSLHGPPPAEGEEVAVTGRFTSAGVLEADEIRLLRSNASVRPGGRRLLKLGRRAAILVVIMFAGVAGAALYETGHAPWAPMITVPRVSPGENLTSVESRLQDAGLRTSWRYATSTSVPFGTVIRVDPPPGTSLRKNSTVAIYINDNMNSP